MTASDPPAETAPSSVGAHELLGPVLTVEIERLREAAARVVDAGGVDVEAIHDFRVALRRLRTALRPARSVYRRKRLRKVEDELRDHAQASGALRDEEVLRETIEELAIDAPARDVALSWLAARRADEPAGRAALAQRVSGAAGPVRVRRRDRRRPLGETLDALVDVLAAPRAREEDGPALAAAALGRAARDVIAASSVDATDGVGLHDLRICFKRLRYTAELFAPLFAAHGAEVGERAATMQKRLGEVHDFDQALARVGAARDLDAATRTSLSAALAEGRARAVRRALAELPKAVAAARAVAPKDVTEGP